MPAALALVTTGPSVTTRSSSPACTMRARESASSCRASHSAADIWLLRSAVATVCAIFCFVRQTGQSQATGSSFAIRGIGTGSDNPGFEAAVGIFIDGAYQALWWVPAGTIPTINDGLSRLWYLDRFGPSPHAFTFKARFPVPGETVPPVDMQPDPWCVGRA